MEGLGSGKGFEFCICGRDWNFGFFKIFFLVGKLSWRVSLKISLGFCWVGVASQNCTLELCRRGVLWKFSLPRSTLNKFGFFRFLIIKKSYNVYRVYSFVAAWWGESSFRASRKKQSFYDKIEFFKSVFAYWVFKNPNEGARFYLVSDASLWNLACKSSFMTASHWKFSPIGKLFLMVSLLWVFLFYEQEDNNYSNFQTLISNLKLILNIVIWLFSFQLQKSY